MIPWMRDMEIRKRSNRKAWIDWRGKLPSTNVLFLIVLLPTINHRGVLNPHPGKYFTSMPTHDDKSWPFRSARYHHPIWYDTITFNFSAICAQHSYLHQTRLSICRLMSRYVLGNLIQCKTLTWPSSIKCPAINIIKLRGNIRWFSCHTCR